MSSFDGIPNRFHLTLFKIFIYRIPCRKPPNSRPKPQRHSWTTSESDIYEDIVCCLASVGRFQWIEEILEDQKKYEDISKEGFTDRLILLYGRSDIYEQAYKVFDEMPNRGLLSFNAFMGLA
ncbi:hypothetical protein V6N12_033022 [Hibiscus sabdariffa]|uniref:Pentatricopeptide repeat-containing protein n=1 Tax=Hibiscus sabdariffa TaxID=183260 RepID=A0ABR2CEU1_9ROSI